MGGIEHVARSIGAVLGERLPWQRKTQRENLALLVATMLSERSANLMALAGALPRRPDRIDIALPVDRARAGEPADRVRCGDDAVRARGAGAGACRGTARRAGGTDPGSEPG